MNRKGSHGRRQSEISDAAAKAKDGMDEKLRDLGLERDDVLVTRETLGELEGDGTEEGCQEVVEAIERAEGVARETFERDGCILKDIHYEGKEQAEGLQDGRESVERDVERIIGATGRINVRDNVRDLEQAREKALQDKDFLERHIVINGYALDST